MDFEPLAIIAVVVGYYRQVQISIFQLLQEFTLFLSIYEIYLDRWMVLIELAYDGRDGKLFVCAGIPDLNQRLILL